MDWGNAIVRTKAINNEGKVTAIEMDLHLEGYFRKTKKKITWLAQPTAEHALVNATLLDHDYLITKKKLEEDAEREREKERNSTSSPNQEGSGSGSGGGAGGRASDVRVFGESVRRFGRSCALMTSQARRRPRTCCTRKRRSRAGCTRATTRGTTTRGTSARAGTA